MMLTILCSFTFFISLGTTLPVALGFLGSRALPLARTIKAEAAEAYLRQGHGFVSLRDRQCVETAATPSPNNHAEPPAYNIVILGGAGKIGTAAGVHLLLRSPQSRITLVGRRPEQGRIAIENMWNEYHKQSDKEDSVVAVNFDDDDDRIQFVCVEDVWNNDDPILRRLVRNADCLIHTAGPFLDRMPTPLLLAMEYSCPAYVDISDPIPFLDASLAQNQRAQESGTTALLAAGAFPGLSNVLAMEAAAATATLDSSSRPKVTIKDVRFAYFTAGLGGSGPLNLYITNLGFGEPMAQFDNGQLRFYEALSGRLLGDVDFSLPTNANANDNNDKAMGFGNEQVRERVGRRQVFAWPFPEAATVPKELGGQGNSWACMGTAPDIWNVMLGILVDIVPRSLWRNPTFSKFLADFSQPLVFLSDQYLKATDVNQVGETHAMRIDVTTADDTEQETGHNNNKSERGISIVQAHDSFRQCVGQSCAEFALDCLQHPEVGVRLTEQRYRDSGDRERIIHKLTSTPGTFAYTGPVIVESIRGPSNLGKALITAEEDEAKALGSS